MYKSKFEAEFARQLKINGIKFKYEPTVVEFLQPEKRRKYTPDFEIKTKANGSIFIETKGKLTSEDRKKMIWVRDQNPWLNIVLVFQNASNKLTKRSKTTYGDWATKNGFTWFDFRDKKISKDWR